MVFLKMSYAVLGKGKQGGIQLYSETGTLNESGKSPDFSGKLQ